MDTGNIQLNTVDFLTVSDEVEAAFGKFVKSNILCGIITFRFQAVSDNVTWQTFCYLSNIVDFTVDDKDTIFIQLLGELSEGMTDIVDIFEEIQMVLLDI